MDKPQWGYALFDAGCWGYASVTISTLAPLVFVRRIKEAMPVQKFANNVWEAGEREEQAIWHGMQTVEHGVEHFHARGRHDDAFLRGVDRAAALASVPYGPGGTSGLMEGWEYDANKTGSMSGLDLDNASGTWVMMVAISTLLAGIACPILGAIADRYSARKVITFSTAFMSVVFMSIFAFESKHSDWQQILAVRIPPLPLPPAPPPHPQPHQQ